MRTTYWMAGLTLFISSLAPAQEAPKMEFFGGYTDMRVNGSASLASLIPSIAGTSLAVPVRFPRTFASGWSAGGAYNPTRWLGVVADFSGVDGNSSETAFGTPVAINLHEYNFLAGPRFSYRGKRWTLFAHALGGAGHGSVSVGAAEVLQPLKSDETKLTLAAGAGLDCKIYRKLAVRVAQVDWLDTRFVGGRQSNLRFTMGLVLRL